MSAIIQYDLFKPIPTREELWELDMMSKTNAIKESSDKVRKKLFAENGVLKKRVDDLECRMQVIEKNICAGVS